MDDIVHHLQAVVRGTKRMHIVCDLPFMSYQADDTEAIRNAGRLLKAGAQSVKPEGGRRLVDMIRRMVEVGIPVMGHIGLTPQSVNQLSGFRVQGRDPEDAKSIIEDALALQDAGVYGLVLETIPTELALEITSKVSIPTVGIGAGVHCDGQVLVFHDVFGLNTGRKKKHVRKYANLAKIVTNATKEYMADIQSGEFPGEEESFSTVKQIVQEATSAAS